MLRLVPGLSSCLFPGSSIARQDYDLLPRHCIAAVEIGCEHAGAALVEDSLQDRLAALVRGAQPPVHSLHAPYRSERDLSALDEERRQTAVSRTIEALELAVRLGAGVVVVHASEEPLAAGQRPHRLSQARKSLASLASEARELDLRLAVETMPPEWLPAGSAESSELVQGLDPQVVGFCLDTNHANLTGDLSEIIHALGPRLWNVHISDNDGLRQRHWLPLRGVIDWRAFMESLAAVRYEGPLIYELDPHPAGPGCGLEEIEENFARLEALIPAPG